MFVTMLPADAKVRGVSGIVPASGKGTVHLCACVRDECVLLILQDVLFIPQSGKNLLSTSALERNGKHISFKNGVVCVYNNNNKIIAVGSCASNLFGAECDAGAGYKPERGDGFGADGA